MFVPRFAAPACDKGVEMPALADDGRDESFSFEEFEECVNSMKSGKAAGADAMPAELFKYSHAAKLMLYELCAKVWAKETVPEEFVLGLMVMVHKKGDTNDLINYRPICLLSHAYVRSCLRSY